MAFLPKGRLARAGVAGVAALAIIQLVPYGRAHQNPPVTGEPNWDSPATQKLAERACFDCHSHQTRWPWYSHVAPVSWLVQRDVEKARQHLNFSAWDHKQPHAEDAAEEFEDGEMPPWFYSPLHAEARLTDAEKAQLVQGFKATFPPSKTAAAKGTGHTDSHAH